MQDLGSTIVDRQNEKGWFWQSVHVLSLNVIVLLRYRFGYKFFAPIGFYISHWIIFFAVSLVHSAIFKTNASLYLKGVTLGLYFLQMAVAHLNHMFSKHPPHRNSPGTSILTRLIPGSTHPPLPGEMSVEWKIHVIVEPILAGVAACVVCKFEPYLGCLLLLSSGALWLKDLHNWHDYRDKWVITGEIVADVPVVGGQPYIAPRPQPMPTPKRGLGRFFGQVSLSPKMIPQGNGIKRLPRVHTPAPPTPSQATASALPSSSRPVPPPLPPAVSPAELEHAKILKVPPGGIQDFAHLQALWRQGLKIHYPTSVQDPARFSEANAATQKLNAAYVYYKARYSPSAAQRPSS